MRVRVRPWPAFAVLAIAVIALPATGCQSARFAAKRQVRDQRIRELGRLYAAREATASKQLQHIADVQRELRGRHAKRLRDTLQLIEDDYHRDVRRWREQSPVRRDRFRAMLEGRPAEIPEFVAETIY